MRAEQADGRVTVRVFASRDQAERARDRLERVVVWAEVEDDPGGFAVTVLPQHRERAGAVLAAAERKLEMPPERRPSSRIRFPDLETVGAAVGLALLGALVVGLLVGLWLMAHAVGLAATLVVVVAGMLYIAFSGGSAAVQGVLLAASRAASFYAGAHGTSGVAGGG